MGQLFSSPIPGVQQSNYSESMTRPIAKPKVDTLHSRVLKWTIGDVLNSKFFKTQMRNIPMEFESIAEYIGAFRVPVLEEVRAQVHQALEKSISQGKGQVVDVTRIDKLRGKNEDPSMTRLDLKLPLHARGTTPVRGFDLILLCRNKLPKWDSKQGCLMPRSLHQFVLAMVYYTRDEHPVFTAVVHLPVECPFLENLRLPSTVLFAVALGMSLTPAERIWASLSKIASATPEKAVSVIQDVLQIPRQIEAVGTDSLNLPQELEAVDTLQRVEEYCNSRRLNDSQKGALKSTIAGLLTSDTKCHVRMVQGPPGTGKTAMLAHLICVLGCLECRSLISAPTNAAVIEVCKRMMTFFPVQPEKENDPAIHPEMFSAFCTRVTRGHSKGRRCSPIELSEVVLVGSKGRMEAFVKGTSLEMVFLPHRIERLMAALSLVTGWKGRVQSVETFLTNAPTQFYRASHTSSEKKEVNAKQQNDSFWSFVTEYMKDMQAQMETHLLTLTRELPRCLISEDTSEAMIRTLKLLKIAVDAMPSKAPVNARSWFSKNAPDTLTELMANVSLSESQRFGGPKLKFLQAREALQRALACRAGSNPLATEKNPQGRQPKFGWLGKQCLKNAILVFSTVSAAASPLLENATFDCAIIDEASQLVEAESTIVSGKRGLKQLILVGDHKQLPATVISKVAETSGYGRSLFDRLQSLKHGCRHMLNIQYRMKPEISHFPNSQFYGSGVRNGANVLSQEYGRCMAGTSRYGAYAFVNCRVGVEEAHDKSWRNPKEVAVVIKMVQHLGQVCEERHIKHLSVGIISPYGMQVEAVKKALGNLHDALDVQVRTVDGFQGNERDVIILTAVRANQYNQIGFVHDGRRLNVAITRGRFCVWIVGNAVTLSRGGELWDSLITDAKARNCFFDLEHHHSMLRTPGDA